MSSKSSKQARDVEGAYKEALIDEHDSYVRSGQPERAEQVARVLREEYGHDVDSKAAPKKKDEEPEKKADPGTPENTAEQAPPENTAAPKASEAQPAAAKKTAAKKTAAPARKPADTQG